MDCLESYKASCFLWNMNPRFRSWILWGIREGGLHTQTHTPQANKKRHFLSPSICKACWLEFTAVIISIWRQGVVLLSTENIYWFVFPPIFTMCPYHPSGLYESDSESALLKLGIPPVLERVGTQIFLFLICLLLSVKSDLFRVLITTLFMVSKISGLGTGTRLKSLAHQTEIHF